MKLSFANDIRYFLYLFHIMLSIQEKIRALRSYLKLTQSEFAAKINLSRSNYSHLEIGKSNPTVKTIKDIANAFCINADYFFKENLTPEMLPNLIGNDVYLNVYPNVYLNEENKENDVNLNVNPDVNLKDKKPKNYQPHKEESQVQEQSITYNSTERLLLMETHTKVCRLEEKMQEIEALIRAKL